MSNSIRVSVNGEARLIPAAETVTALLARLDIPVERVAIELNGNIVRKRDWDRTLVNEGSQIEIVEFVGGG